jgi:putative transposase
MARPLRIEYSGAWYHVMNRGAGRRTIFKNNAQRRYFLSLLQDTHDRFNAEWHAYCLMGNHYHLLLRTPEANLQRIMRHLNGLYTQFFNRSERKDGSLFRGRYKAILVDAQSYWLQLSRYIHRNPLEAKLCYSLTQYPWSSYRAYIGADKAPDWLTTKYTLNAIGTRNVHLRYKAYVSKPVGPEIQKFYDRKKINPVLGDDAFKTKVLARKPKTVDVPELGTARVVPSLNQVIETTCRYYNVDENTIWRQIRGKGVTSPARSVAMYLFQHAANMRLAEIAETFGLASYASAGATIRQVKQRRATDKTLDESINYIILDLTP